MNKINFLTQNVSTIRTTLNLPKFYNYTLFNTYNKSTTFELGNDNKWDVQISLL